MELYNEVIKDEFGIIKGMKVKIYVDVNVKLKFCKVCFVLYVFKDKIEYELDCFINEGILLLIEFGGWVIMIVFVLKLNGKVCICGNYKCIVNLGWKLDSYFIFKIEDLFVILGGGNKYLKLDML